MATINDILTEVDELKPNVYDDLQKIKWLNTLEKKIIKDVINTHETEFEFEEHNSDDVNDELIVAEPYAEIYTYYLFAMIDFHNNEMDRYQGTMAMFNSSYQDFVNHFNRNNKPLSFPLLLN